MFDILVKPILSYACGIGAIVGNSTDSDEESAEIPEEIAWSPGADHISVCACRAWKVSCSFHVRPWQVNTWTAWRAWIQILLENSFVADCPLLASKSWRSCFEDQLHSHLVSMPIEDMAHRQQLSLPSAYTLAWPADRCSSADSHIKVSYASEP